MTVLEQEPPNIGQPRIINGVLTHVIGCQMCGWPVRVPAQAREAWCAEHSGYDRQVGYRLPRPEPRPEPSQAGEYDHLSFSEKIAVGMEMVEKITEEGRRKGADVRLGRAERRDPELLEHHAGKNPAYGEVAGKLGMPKAFYKVGRQVLVQALEHPDIYGDLIEMMDRDRSPHPARHELYRRRGQWKLAHPGESEPVVVPVEPEPKKPRGPTAAQVARAIPQALATLEGVCLGLQGLPLDQLTPEDRERWSKGMRAVTRQLNAFIRDMGKQEETEK